MERNFKLQGEYFWRARAGDLTYDATAPSGLRRPATIRSDQSGFYVQGVWQFMPTWRLGVRYDWLNPGSIEYGANGAYLGNTIRSIRSERR